MNDKSFFIRVAERSVPAVTVMRKVWIASLAVHRDPSLAHHPDRTPGHQINLGLVQGLPQYLAGMVLALGIILEFLKLQPTINNLIL